MDNDLLHLIAFDKDSKNIKNYKHSVQGTHLGAFCCFFISAFMCSEMQNEQDEQDKWKQSVEKYLDDLKNMLAIAYRRDARRSTDQSIPNNEFNEAVKTEANRLAQKHIDDLKNSAGFDV